MCNSTTPLPLCPSALSFAPHPQLLNTALAPPLLLALVLPLFSRSLSRCLELPCQLLTISLTSEEAALAA